MLYYLSVFSYKPSITYILNLKDYYITCFQKARSANIILPQLRAPICKSAPVSIVFLVRGLTSHVYAYKVSYRVFSYRTIGKYITVHPMYHIHHELCDINRFSNQYIRYIIV